MADLDRRLSLASELRTRSRNERLSSYLGDVKLLATLAGDESIAFLVDLLNYGADRTQACPSAAICEAAWSRYSSLCGIINPSDVDLDTLSRPVELWDQPKDAVIHVSVQEMENQDPMSQIERTDSYRLAQAKVRANLYLQQRKAVLSAIRAFIRDYINTQWIELSKEKDRVNLLGPDYGIVLDSLDALQTGVGGELRTAVDLLRSPEPASWRSAGITCRQVVLRLGTLLFSSSSDTYHCEDGTPLCVRRDREKNRLYAYLDYFCRNAASSEQRASFGEARGLVEHIYDTGSDAKRYIRYEEAQGLVERSFHLVGLLLELTGLQKVSI